MRRPTKFNQLLRCKNLCLRLGCVESATSERERERESTVRHLLCSHYKIIYHTPPLRVYVFRGHVDFIRSTKHHWNMKRTKTLAYDAVRQCCKCNVSNAVDVVMWCLVQGAESSYNQHTHDINNRANINKMHTEHIAKNKFDRYTHIFVILNINHWTIEHSVQRMRCACDVSSLQVSIQKISNQPDNLRIQMPNTFRRRHDGAVLYFTVFLFFSHRSRLF